MEIINPINAETCSSYQGRPVCAVMHDGRRVYGYLSRVENNQLILTNQPTVVGTSSQGKNKKGKKAHTSQVYPYPPYGGFAGGALALDLALIALLFAVPFFFW